MDDKDKSFLLGLSRKAIEAKLDSVNLVANDVPKSLTKKGSCFVTLTIDGELRGCIGHLEAFEPLYLNVINNSVNAAFSDGRFPPLTKKEFGVVKIEISVLSKPERLVYLNSSELLDRLSSQYGVILKKGFYQSTFLPQVWEVIPDKVEFLENLCTKAGLHPSAWRDNVEIFVYTVDKFHE